MGYTNSPSLEAYELWDCGLTFDELNDSINQALRQVRTTDRFWLVPPTDSARTSFLRVALPLDVQGWCTQAGWIESVSTQSEPPTTTASLSASLVTAAAYASAMVTWKRDRSQGGVTRVQVTTGTVSTSGTTLTATWAADTTPGNTLLAFVTAYSGTIVAPSGWTAGPTTTSGTMRTSVFYVSPSTAAHTGTETFTVGTATPGSLTLVEYAGLLAGGIDATATAGGTSATVTSGITQTTAQGDELWLAVLGVNSGEALFTPTNRFSRMSNPRPSASTYTNPAYHAVYERILTVTDLEDRALLEVGGSQHDPAVEEGGTVYLWPDRPVTPPSAYVVQARRPLYSFCRPDSSGQFGAKTDGLTAEGNQTNGGLADELLDIIVAGAITEAYERYPTFRAMAEGERLACINQSRARFSTYLRASQPARNPRFREREMVG